MKSGVFWNYFEHNPKDPIIQEEKNSKKKAKENWQVLVLWIKPNSQYQTE